jgi:transcriptional regulator with XRE-family HTH domain
MTAQAELTLTPELLGIWIGSSRKALEMSQEALAEISGLTARTIQRVEKGEPVNRQSRRSLARALGFEDYDAFDNPERIAAFLEMMKTLAKWKADEEAQALKKQHPDHLSLDAELVEDGRRLTSFSEALCGLGMHIADNLSAEEQDASLGLADYLRDYGDISNSFTNFGERKAYQTEIAEIIEDLKTRGISVYTAIRRTKLMNDSWKDKTPLPWTIGYLVFSHERVPSVKVLVPKRVQL